MASESNVGKTFFLLSQRQSGGFLLDVRLVPRNDLPARLFPASSRISESNLFEARPENARRRQGKKEIRLNGIACAKSATYGAASLIFSIYAKVFGVISPPAFFVLLRGNRTQILLKPYRKTPGGDRKRAVRPDGLLCATSAP